MRTTWPRTSSTPTSACPRSGGRSDVAAVLRGLDRPSMSFEVYIHSSAASGPVVLNERTDVINVGPVRAQFWVCGRFEVHDGHITVWRDYFDNLDILRGVGRACSAHSCRP
ncbi:MAG: limonene-1,2-epoxide hydrolase family protein [Microthrixaceae bacterium]